MSYLKYAFESAASGIYASVVYYCVERMRPINPSISFSSKSTELLSLAFFLYFIGFVKHEIGYYLTVKSNYCQQTGICKKNTEILYTGDTNHLTWIDKLKIAMGFAENVWFEAVGEGILFVVVGIPAFLFVKPYIFAAFLTGVIADLIAEYSDFHSYFCRKSCGIYPLEIGGQLINWINP